MWHPRKYSLNTGASGRPRAVRKYRGMNINSVDQAAASDKRIFTTNAAKVLSCALLLFIGSCRAAEPPPNIILIVADDLGYAELGCYGQQKIRTPNIDSLADEGMRLMRHYSGSPVCAPSRAVLMTGKHPGHAWVRDNREHQPEGQAPLTASEVTLAERLSARGYTCGAFGKWGLGYPGSEGDPLEQGFQRFFGYNCQRHAHSYYPDYLWDDDRRLPLDNRPPVPGHAELAGDADPADPSSYKAFQGTDYASDRIADQALSFIRENSDRPFFLYYPTIVPHLALHVPSDSLAEYTSLGWEDPPAAARYTPHFTPRAAYAAMISRMDSAVGRVLDLLDELELAENTIVIFTSDNGTTYLGPMAEFFESVGPLRGLKGSSYEGGLRVPAIIRYPGRIQPGSVNHTLSGFEDWTPTLLALTGEAEDSIDGADLTPALMEGATLDRPFLYREFAGYGGQQAVWFGDWKGIRPRLVAGDTSIELYDLSKDVGESLDVSDSHPEIVTRVAEIMAREHQPSQLFPLEAIDTN